MPKYFLIPQPRTSVFGGFELGFFIAESLFFNWTLQQKPPHCKGGFYSYQGKIFLKLSQQTSNWSDVSVQMALLIELQSHHPSLPTSSFVEVASPFSEQLQKF